MQILLLKTNNYDQFNSLKIYFLKHFLSFIWLLIIAIVVIINLNNEKFWQSITSICSLGFSDGLLWFVIICFKYSFNTSPSKSKTSSWNWNAYFTIKVFNDALLRLASWRNRLFVNNTQQILTIKYLSSEAWFYEFREYSILICKNIAFIN